MSALEKATALIKQWEDCKLTAYLCPAGVWTIGWGATGQGIGPGVTWTQAKADRRLAADVASFADAVRSAVKVPTEPHEMAALTSLAYNIGAQAFRDSTLLRKLNAEDMQGAANEFPKWRMADGEVSQGLVNRRAAERAIFEGVQS